MGAARVFAVLFGIALAVLWLVWTGFSAYFVFATQRFYDYELFSKEYVAGKVLGRALAYTSFYGLSSNTAVSVAATSADGAFVNNVIRLPGFLVAVSVALFIITIMFCVYASRKKYRSTLVLSLLILLATVGQFLAVWFLFQQVGASGNSLDQFSLNSFDNANLNTSLVIGFGDANNCCMNVTYIPSATLQNCQAVNGVTPPACQTSVVQPLAHTYFDGIIKGTYGFFGLELLVVVFGLWVGLADRSAANEDKASPFDGDRFL